MNIAVTLSATGEFGLSKKINEYAYENNCEPISVCFHEVGAYLYAIVIFRGCEDA